MVEVRDEQERVVEGVTVQFELGENGLALDSTPTTDANGQASATIRFGDTPGEFAVEVSVDGIDEPVVFTATAITSSGLMSYTSTRLKLHPIRTTSTIEQGLRRRLQPGRENARQRARR